MTLAGWLQIGLFSLIIAALIRPFGTYLFRTFESGHPPLPRVLGPLERLLYRICGIDPTEEQSYSQYALALLLFSAFGALVTYFIQRVQQVLPLNPQHF